MLFKCQKFLKFACSILIIGFISIGWKLYPGKVPSDALRAAEKCLQQCFDTGVRKNKLKKYEIQISDKGFLRLRKYYPNGKEEYYSFNLKKLIAMDYFGSSASGTLALKTKSDDIIVQSFNDAKGDVDSMSSTLTIPLKNIEAEQLNELYAGLVSMR